MDGKGSRAAEVWVTALPAGSLRKSALASLVTALALTEPAHAVDLAGEISFTMTRMSSDQVPEFVHSLFDKWTDEDPTAAAAAAAKLPDTFLFRNFALLLVGKRWADQDLARAFAWANSFGPATDTKPLLYNPRQSNGVRFEWR